MAEDLMQTERDVRKKRLPLRRTLMKGAQLGVGACLIMSVLLDMMTLLLFVIQGKLDDSVLMAVQVGLLLLPLLTILPVVTGGMLNAMTLRKMALHGPLPVQRGLITGACAGLLWGLLIYLIGVIVVSNPHRGLEFDLDWLAMAASSGALAGCWHGWRMVAHVEWAMGLGHAVSN